MKVRTHVGRPIVKGSPLRLVCNFSAASEEERVLSSMPSQSYVDSGRGIRNHEPFLR